MQAARTKRFTMKIIMTDKSIEVLENEAGEFLDNAKGIKVDRGSIQNTTGAQAFLLEYIITNGVYLNGRYLIGQMNIDLVFAIATGINCVFYGKPPRRLEFSTENYNPEIKLSNKSDGSVSLKLDGELAIIPGKYSTFIIKDNKLTKINEDIPYSFIEKTRKNITVGPGMRNIFLKSVVPKLKDVISFIEPEPFRLKPVVEKDIPPVVNIYVKYSREDEEIYILPEIQYEDYLSINPYAVGVVEMFDDFYNASPKMEVPENAEQEDCLIQFNRDIYKEYNVFWHSTRISILHPMNMEDFQ